VPTKKDIDESTRRLFVANAELLATIASEGEALAKANGYTGLKGLDAVHRFLIDKYHWLPDEVRRLSVDDLQILLAGVETNPRAKRGR